MEVLSKYVKIKLDDINITREEQDGVEMLALNITLPETKPNGQGQPEKQKDKA